MIFVICFWCSKATARNYYEYSPLACRAYQEIMQLQLSEGQQSLDQMRREEPGNLVVHQLQNSLDFLRIYTSNEESLYLELRKQKDTRLQALQQGPEDAPEHLYLQAYIRLQWAVLKLRFKDYYSGFLDIRKGYQLLEKNRAKFPDYIPNLKELALLHVMIGTVPDNYQWGIKFLIGIDADIEKGMANMHRVLEVGKQQGALYYREAVMLFGFALIYTGREAEEAWTLLQKHPLSYTTNLLDAYTYASIAVEAGRSARALEVLQQVAALPQWNSFAYLEFMLGETMLFQLDTKAADHFKAFLSANQGEKNIKAAYQRLAWCAFLDNNQSKYNYFRQQCLTRGEAISGADTDAAWAEKNDWPLTGELLKARLLFDGGHYQRAMEALMRTSPAVLTKPELKVEWYYRRARVFQQLKKFPEALDDYRHVLEKGQALSYYFACNAALQSGLICEALQQTEEARNWFKQCLDLKPDLYANSLHQRAKAGLQRLK